MQRVLPPFFLGGLPVSQRTRAKIAVACSFVSDDDDVVVLLFFFLGFSSSSSSSSSRAVVSSGIDRCTCGATTPLVSPLVYNLTPVVDPPISNPTQGSAPLRSFSIDRHHTTTTIISEGGSMQEKASSGGIFADLRAAAAALVKAHPDVVQVDEAAIERLVNGAGPAPVSLQEVKEKAERVGLPLKFGNALEVRDT
jgi:hypothetical protein